MIALVSCNRDDDFLPPPDRGYWGECSVLKNGQNWTPKIVALDATRDWPGIYGIEMATYDQYNIIRQTFSIFGLPLNTRGKMLINEQNAQLIKAGRISAFYNTVIEDGDVVGDAFLLDTLSHNYIDITEIKGNEIKGTFDITFLRDTTRPKYLESSDTLRFIDGKFHTRIIKAK